MNNKPTAFIIGEYPREEETFFMVKMETSQGFFEVGVTLDDAGWKVDELMYASNTAEHEAIPTTQDLAELALTVCQNRNN
jgi:hypothetical protein